MSESFESEYEDFVSLSGSLGDVTIQPANVGPQDVLRTSPSNVPRTSPKDPICPSWGRPYLMFRGRPNLTSWGRPEMKSRGRLNLTFKGRPWKVDSGRP